MRKTYQKLFFVSILSTSIMALFYFKGKQAQAQTAQKIVEHVDVQKLLGSWYEISRLPNLFQSEDWIGARDHYEMTETGHLRVRYRYHVKSFDAPEKEFLAKMWRNPEDMPTGRFQYQAFWPITVDYWVIDLDPDYQYMVIGYPNRSMVWVMSRSPSLDETLYEEILLRLKAQGYDISKLIRVPQRKEAPVFSEND